MRKRVRKVRGRERIKEGERNRKEGTTVEVRERN